MAGNPPSNGSNEKLSQLTSWIITTVIFGPQILSYGLPGRITVLTSLPKLTVAAVEHSYTQ